MEVDFSPPALRVIRVLESLKEFRGLPKMIRVDNGLEFISYSLDEWCRKHGISLVYIQPGKPMQNGYVERCIGSVRRELLNTNVFYTPWQKFVPLLNGWTTITTIDLMKR